MEIVVDKNNKYYLFKSLEKEGANHLSFSEFNLFIGECGFKHLIFKHLKLIEPEKSIHLHFGNSLHETLEMMVKNFNLPQENAVIFFKNTFQTYMLSDMANTKEYKEDYPMFVLQGEAIIKSLDLKNTYKDYIVIGTEIPFYEHVFENFYFKGFIDLILKHRKTGIIKIIDYKSSGTSWNPEYKIGKDYNKDIKKEDLIIDSKFIFICQMFFYAFFYGRKSHISPVDIETVYVVLNRLKDKYSQISFPGSIQKFTIHPTQVKINAAKRLLFDTFNKIYKTQTFDKVKFKGNEKYDCKFCPLKGEKIVKLKNGKKLFCDKNERQDKELLKEYGKLNTQAA